MQRIWRLRVRVPREVSLFFADIRSTTGTATNRTCPGHSWYSPDCCLSGRLEQVMYVHRCSINLVRRSSISRRAPPDPSLELSIETLTDTVSAACTYTRVARTGINFDEIAQYTTSKSVIERLNDDVDCRQCSVTNAFPQSKAT